MKCEAVYSFLRRPSFLFGNAEAISRYRSGIEVRRSREPFAEASWVRCPQLKGVEVIESMKIKSIWRWVLIIGWLICAMFAFIDLPKELLAKMYFICCLVLCAGNVGELINGN